MESAPGGKKRAIVQAYNSAAPYYDHPELAFWQSFGEQLVASAGVREGDRVIDLCCGSGASALAAARKVGPYGRVLGVDLTPRLLDLARAKAKSEGLDWIEFVEGDIEKLEFAEGFDVALCGLSLFLFDDMLAPVRKMIECTRPGGTVAVSMWGEGYWEPFNTLLDKLIARHVGIEGRTFNRGSPFRASADLIELLKKVNLLQVEVTSSAATHAVHGAGGWWQVVLGSGYQGTLRLLSAEELDEIRRQHFAELAPLVEDDGMLHLPCPIYFAAGRTRHARGTVTASDRAPSLTVEIRALELDEVRADVVRMKTERTEITAAVAIDDIVPEGRPRRWRIRAVAGEDAGREFIISEETVLVGRGPAAMVRLKDPSVSSKHVELRLMPQLIVAVDLRSTNGTFAQGVRVEHALLAPGEELRLGAVRLCFELAESEG